MALSPMPCLGCGGVKPPGRGLRYCETCERKPTRLPGIQTACHACGSRENKLPNTHFCEDCRALRQWREEKREKARKLIERQPCAKCGGRKPAGRGEQYCAACKAINHQTLRCLQCKTAPVRASGKRLCAACHEAGLQRARDAERERGRKRRDDDAYREQARERSRASKLRMNQDPVWKARSLETQRMQYRLRAQREGREVRAIRSAHDAKSWLPGRPLVAAIDRRALSSDLAAVCELTGKTERQIYRWRTGETNVSLVDADDVLTALDLLWWEVWSEATVRIPFFTASVYVNRMKMTKAGDRPIRRVLYRSTPYGDAGPDLGKLQMISALMAGEAVAA